MSLGEENLIRTELNQAQRRLEIEKRQMNAKKICEMCDAWNEDNEKSKCFIKHCQHIIDNFCLHASIFRYWSNEISLRADCIVQNIYSFVSSTCCLASFLLHITKLFASHIPEGKWWDEEKLFSFSVPLHRAGHCCCCYFCHSSRVW